MYYKHPRLETFVKLFRRRLHSFSREIYIWCISPTNTFLIMQYVQHKHNLLGDLESHFSMYVTNKTFASQVPFYIEKTILNYACDHSQSFVS